MTKLKKKIVRTHAQKPIAALFVGDLHVGSDTGLCIPGYKLPSKEDRPYPASTRQEWLYQKWNDLIKYAQELSATHRVFLGIGGDAVDGVAHHDTTQTIGTYSDQEHMAAELLKPLVALADDAKGLLGTAAHVQDMGNADRNVLDMLRVDARAMWRLDIGPRRLWWAHHGVSVGLRAWTDDSPMILLARDIYFRCMDEQRHKPDAIIGHDRHVAPEPISVKGISVGVCPCWQLGTYWGEGISPFKHVTIGGLLWNVETNTISIKSYFEERDADVAFSAHRG